MAPNGAPLTFTSTMSEDMVYVPERWERDGYTAIRLGGLTGRGCVLRGASAVRRRRGGYER